MYNIFIVYRGFVSFEIEEIIVIEAEQLKTLKYSTLYRN